MAARSVKDLDRAYQYASQRLADHPALMDSATDVYGIRKDELTSEV